MKNLFIILVILFIIFSVTLLTGNVRSVNEEVKPNTMDNVNIDSTPQSNKTVVMKTSKGDITIELFNESKPITANNFLKLANEGFYDGLTFHRVISGFMIQGGDPNGNGTGGPGYSIPDELGNDNKNDKGTLSMANSGPNTGGSQFFINLVDNNYLDDKHAVFGKVTSGMDIVEKIGSVETDSQDMPIEKVLIEKIEVAE